MIFVFGWRVPSTTQWLEQVCLTYCKLIRHHVHLLDAAQSQSECHRQFAEGRCTVLGHKFERNPYGTLPKKLLDFRPVTVALICQFNHIHAQSNSVTSANLLQIVFHTSVLILVDSSRTLGTNPTSFRRVCWSTSSPHLTKSSRIETSRDLFHAA